jgi:hypothetical protein
MTFPCLVALFAVLLQPAARTEAATTPAFDADVLIQAGHQGRPDCSIEPASLCNNTGARGEIELTPVVADATARILRAAGITVIRKPARIERTYHVRDALFIHFDGSVQPCASGASVGYPQVADSRAAAQQWKAVYARGWRFGFQPDNFTESLRDYFGYKHVVASDAAILVEFGELTCPAQAAWLRAHLAWEAASLAHFVSLRLHRGNVPAPALP